MRLLKLGPDPRGRLIAVADDTRRLRGGPPVPSRIHIFDGVEMRKLGEVIGPEVSYLRLIASGAHVILGDYASGTIAGFESDGRPLWSTAVRSDTLDALVMNPLGPGVALRMSEQVDGRAVQRLCPLDVERGIVGPDIGRFITELPGGLGKMWLAGSTNASGVFVVCGWQLDPTGARAPASKLDEMLGKEPSPKRIATTAGFITSNGRLQLLWSKPRKLVPLAATDDERLVGISVDERKTGIVWLDPRTGDVVREVDCAVGHRSAIFAMGRRALRDDGAIFDTSSGALVEQLAF